MYRYRIAIPANYSDQLVAVLRDNASVEGVVPLPPDLQSNDPLDVQSDVPMAVFLVRDPHQNTPGIIHRWLETRNEPQLDIRGEDSQGHYTLSFAAHTLDEIERWAAERTLEAGRSY